MNYETENMGFKAQFTEDNYTFEEMRSMEQDLSFDAAANAFKKYGVPFGAEKYRALGITQKNDELFTNLALIISDQCAHTTKVAVFGDDSNTVFKDNKEFGGSVFTQLEDTFNYLMLCNRTQATFKGLERIEKQERWTCPAARIRRWASGLSL